MFCFSALLKPPCISILNCKFFGLLCNKRLLYLPFLVHASASGVSFYTFVLLKFEKKRFASKFLRQSAILDISDDYGDLATFKQNLLRDRSLFIEGGGGELVQYGLLDFC